MNNNSSQPGYVMVLSLLLMSLIIFLVTNMADKGRVHVQYLKVMIDRQKAKQLAFSGVQVALSQLANMDQSQKKDESDFQSKDKQKNQKVLSEDEQARQFLKNFLPTMNQWQTFSLKKKNDGVTGSIKICVGCEDGKININKMFDFVHKKFFNEGQKNGDCKKAMQELFKKIKKQLGGENLFSKFEKFLKERHNKLYDPTELLTIEGFKRFKDALFYEPNDAVKGQDEKVKKTIYLNDIFTLWSFKKEIDPWFLSDSLKVLFGLKILKKSDGQFEEKKIQDLLKKVTAKYSWPNSWKQVLKPLYGVDFKSFSEGGKTLISTKFEPQVFSVLSYGTVGGVTQKLLVIVQRVKKSEKGSTGSKLFEFRTKKFYWL
ncbi:hypothetical protein KAH94_06445 [bacterium]|nr:hypothetical protein [bacterium]